MPLKVPYFRQKTEYFCGPAVTQMVFKYYGKKMSQNYLASILNTNSVYGTNQGDLAKIAKERGFSVVNKTKATLWDIKRFLKSKTPMIVRFIEPSDNEDHYAVVVGLNKRRVIMNDPWNGRGMSMSVADFNKRWKKAGEKRPWGGKWLMAIVKKD